MVSLTFDVGGLERLLIGLMRGLTDRGFEVTLCTLQDPGKLAPALDGSGIDIVALYKGEGLNARTIWALRNLIKERNINIVHTHNPAPLFFGTLASLVTGRKTKVIHTKHGRNIPESKRSVIRNYVCSLASEFVVAVSKDVLELCANIEKVPARKLRLILNGIELQPYLEAAKAKKAKDTLVIGHVGRQDEYNKNQAMLLRVFARFLKSYPHARLALVGDGPNANHLQSLSRELGIAENTEFYGYRDDIPQLMAQFDWFCLSSFSEGMPLVIIEAMAAKTPVISTDVGGLPEIVKHGKSGYLVPAGDDDVMLERWLELAANPDLRMQMGETGQRLVVEQFSLEQMIDQYQHLYEEIYEANYSS